MRIENGKLNHLPFSAIYRQLITDNLITTMDGKNRKDIYHGLEVDIILKKDQRSGTRTKGIVQALLTSSAFHSRGIKVRLEDGQVGRIVEIFE